MISRRFVLGVAIAAIAPPLLPAYQLTLMNFIGLAAIVVTGLVLLTGIGGLTSFGQATFVGVGAYVTAFLTTSYEPTSSPRWKDSSRGSHHLTHGGEVRLKRPSAKPCSDWRRYGPLDA